MIIQSTSPLNAETPAVTLRSAFITPQAEFYIRNHGAVPKIEAGGYRLKIGGRVATELELTLDELHTRFPERRVVAVMQCAGNRRADMNQVKSVEGDPWGPGAIGNAEWTGVSLAAVLKAAGVASAAGLHVAFTSHDEFVFRGEKFLYEVSIPLEKALTRDVLLATGMNGEPLTPAHGFPLRVVVPGYAGARSPKWLASISVQDCEEDGPMQTVEYRLFPPGTRKETAATDPNIVINEMPLNSAICVPAAGANVGAGGARIEGYAVGTRNGVGRVEVSCDGGANWHEAEIAARADSRWSWTFWSVILDLPPGDRELVARSFDDAGACQPEDCREVWNFKGYLANAWHRVAVRVG